LRPEIPQERERRLAIMDVAGPILHPQHVSGFGQVGHDRVVARHFPMVRVEPAERPLDLQPRRDDHAIDIHGHGVQAQPRDDVRNHRGIQRLQPLDGLHRELRQPAADRARRRQDLQLAEAAEQRVIRDVRDVVQAPAADHQQPNQQAHHRHDPEVAAEGPPRNAVRTMALKPIPRR
jgi:hypothetical protein